MTRDSFDKRNFLFFLNEIHLPNSNDSLMSTLASPSSWDAVAAMVTTARQKVAFVRSINRVHLYVHVPFCERICTFCHCSKVLLRQSSEIDAYIKVLKRQMMFFAPVYKGMAADSIYFGGGTPSILDEHQLADILDGVDEAFPISGRKVLFEVHPASWTASKLAVLSSRGLFRLSIGVQSLDDKVLKDVSRSQTRKKVLWCLRSARKAGVPHVNVDFIAGLPGQTVSGLINDIKIIMDEGANIICVQPYADFPLKKMSGSGETVVAFLKRRDALMKAAAACLQEAGFSPQGLLGSFARDGGPEDHQEEAYSHLEEAVAGFGPFAKGQVPGAVYYRAGALKSTLDFPEVNASQQDFSYAMAHYAAVGIITGLDEKVFFQRFGESLDRHCGEGLRYLQQSGLVEFSKGIWKFSGKWEVRRIFEYLALSRVLFGEGLLLRLRERFIKQYDPRQDYSDGNALLKAYTESFCMSLYYRWHAQV